MIDYVLRHTDTVIGALSQHVMLALVPIILAVLISVPFGYLAVRLLRLYQPTLTTAGIIYSIPSLALFLIIPGIIGTQVLSPLNIIIALTIYTAALLVQVVADGLNSVDPSTKEAATAMGYRRLRRLFGVELPMALPAMLAGLRFATVSNISMVSVGALIGVGGLGALFTRGLQQRYPEQILVGLVLTVLLALLCDLIIVLIQRWATPWARADTRKAA